AAAITLSAGELRQRNIAATEGDHLACLRVLWLPTWGPVASQADDSHHQADEQAHKYHEQPTLLVSDKPEHDCQDEADERHAESERPENRPCIRRPLTWRHGY